MMNIRTITQLSAALTLAAWLTPTPAPAAEGKPTCSCCTVAATTGAPQTTAAKIAPAKPYPLKTCLVSDEKLGGAMGTPYVLTREGQEIKLCCKSCLKEFNADPANYLKKLAKAQKSTAPASASTDNPHHAH